MQGRSERGAGRLGLVVALVLLILVVLTAFVLYTLTTGLVGGSHSVAAPPHNTSHNVSAPTTAGPLSGFTPGSIFLGLVVLIFAAVVVAIIAQRRRDRLRPADASGEDPSSTEPARESEPPSSPPPADPLDHML
jgi:hypothetical protein